MNLYIQNMCDHCGFNVPTANLASLSIGCSIGWLSPALRTLESNDTPLSTGPLTVDEVSWVGSLMHLGGLCGFPLYAAIAKRFGRKNAIASLIIPLIVSVKIGQMNFIG